MLQNIFTLDHHCKTQSEFSELLEKGRIACSLYIVIKEYGEYA